MIDYAILPARGGSKRIPHKNLALFNGKSMLERSINLAQSVAKNVIVSSEDSIILQKAKELNAIPFTRDNQLANDFTPTLPVIKNVIETLKINLDSIILCLYPTAMFATKEMIIESLELLKQTNSAYIVPVIENTKAARTFMLVDSKINFIFKEYINTRSQDLPKIYNDAGQFYLGCAKSFVAEIALLGERSRALVIENAIDIDTPFDLDMAQFITKNKLRFNKS